MTEFTPCIFPILEPQLDLTNPGAITRLIKGEEIAAMPNYYYQTTGHYYFAGLYTAVLPMIPGVYSIFRLIKDYKKFRFKIK